MDVGDARTDAYMHEEYNLCYWCHNTLVTFYSESAEYYKNDTYYGLYKSDDICIEYGIDPKEYIITDRGTDILWEYGDNYIKDFMELRTNIITNVKLRDDYYKAVNCIKYLRKDNAYWFYFLPQDIEGTFEIIGIQKFYQTLGKLYSSQYEVPIASLGIGTSTLRSYTTAWSSEATFLKVLKRFVDSGLF